MPENEEFPLKKNNIVRKSPTHFDPIIETLRAERYARRISQRALAAKMGVNHVDISRWESQQHTPGLFLVRIWAEALGYEIKLHKKEG